MQQYLTHLASPFGYISIINDEHHLLSINFLADISSISKPSHPLAKKICEQFECYFTNFSFVFSLPLLEQGTEFQKRVWHKLRTIQSGQCFTYGQLAIELKTSARAIGNACRHNPIPIITPCHRIVGAVNLGGFSGKREGKEWEIKKWLLNHEGACIQSLVSGK